MGKLDPTAYDRWWRSRIEKEETSYVERAMQGLSTSSTPRQSPREILSLNTLGTPQLIPSGKPSTPSSHLVGAAALVRKAQGTSLASIPIGYGPAGGSDGRSPRAGSFQPPGGNKGGSRAGSVASGYSRASGASRAMRGPPQPADDMRSMASGFGPSSQVSYPKTPNFSAAGTEASEILSKLDGLEQALLTERVKRQEAEKEMRQLMEFAKRKGMGK